MWAMGTHNKPELTAVGSATVDRAGIRDGTEEGAG